MTKITNEQVEAGQAVYGPFTLAMYDLAVLGVSNRFIWRCPTPKLLEFYDRHVSANHLDVGVGTGYFLDKCSFPRPGPRIVLMDLNTSSLSAASRRIRRYRPRTVRHNVLEPWPGDGERFDSIGINYLLHCLPGTMQTKGAVFDHLARLLNPGGTLFGATLLGQDVHHNAAARRLMSFYNKKGIFTNTQDDLAGLKAHLARHFEDSGVRTEGCAALFWGCSSGVS